MAALDIAIVAPSLSAIQYHFGIDERASSWVINAFVVFNLIGLSLMTRLSDIYGRRLIYVIDILLFAVGSLVVATAGSYSVLIAGRCLQGLAASGIFPVASAVVGDVYPYEKRGRILGILGAVFGLAFLIGPILGGLLLPYGWQVLFLINIPIAVLIAIAAYRSLPSQKLTREKSTDLRSIDVFGMTVLGLALASLAFGLNGIETNRLVGSISSVRVWPFLAATIIFIFGFVAIERRVKYPLIRLGLLRNRQVRLASVFAAGAGLTEAAFIFLSGYAVASLGVDRSQASFMLVPLVLGVMIGSPVCGRLIDKVGSRVIVFAGSLFVTIGMLVLGLADPSRQSFYVGSVLVGFGLSGLLGSSISYILLNESKVQERTVAQGISTLFISLGQLIGSALIGATIASNISAIAGYQTAFVGLACISLLLVALSMGLKRQADETTTESDL